MLVLLARMTSVEPAVYRDRDFSIYLSSRFLTTIAMQVQSVAVGWQIYGITHSAMSLGLVGLCQFVPMFLLTLPAGDVADRFDQRRVLSLSLFALGLCGMFLLVFTWVYPGRVGPFYAVLVLFGAARGFAGPASQSLMPFLIPKEKLPRAIAWNSSALQIAVIAGPALGGLLYVWGSATAYIACAVCFLAAGAGQASLGGRRREPGAGVATTAIARVAEGVRFVRVRPIILGAISLDLFAVLLGGATALLPVYARDILHIGPIGLGLLRSAPAVGAATVGLLLGRRPIQRHTGRRMFATVALFGAATILFGLSTNFYLTLGALVILGGSDMVSVFIRQSLIQTATPDAMRGRVSAVSVLFIGASNELGEFESGVTAAWFGTVPAVVIGGIGTLAVVTLWMWLFPPLRRVDRLSDVAA